MQKRDYFVVIGSVAVAVLLGFSPGITVASDSDEVQEIEIIKGLQSQDKAGATTNKPVAEVRVWAKKAAADDQKKDDQAGSDGEKPAAAKPEAVAPASVAKLEEEIEKPVLRKSSEPAVTIQDLQALSNALKKKQEELGKARKQIEDLKDTVRKMLDASRRERLSLLNNLACAYEAGGEYKKAEAKFLEALEISPKDSDIVYNLAILYDEDLKDKKRAKHYYQRFLELPGDPRDKEMVRAWLEGLKSDKSNQ